MNFEPLGDRVVIRPDKKVYREKSDGTHGAPIDLVEGDGKEAQSGVIVAIGEDLFGIRPKNRVAMAFEKGRRVVYSPWTGFALTINGETLKILNESEIMGVLTDQETQIEVA